LLNALDIDVVYLDPNYSAVSGNNTSNSELSFEDAAAVFLKFELLKWTHCRRLLFLDADIMPLCNRDYIFHGSDSLSLWEENLILPGPKVAAGGGNFMVNPQHGDFDQLHLTIQRRQANGSRQKVTIPSFRQSFWMGV
jgi:hypothetical protein